MEQPDYLARAYALIPLQRYDLALEEVQRALVADPEAAAPHICAAWVLRAAARFDEAEQAARQAVQAEPNNAAAHGIHAVTLRRLRRWDEAEAAFQTAISLNNTDSGRTFQINHHARLLIDRGKLTEALAQAQESLRLAPHWMYSHELLGRVMYEQGRLDEAEAAFREALRCEPTNAEVHQLLGGALLNNGRTIEAISSLQTALRLAPNDATAQKQLVRALKARFRLYRWGIQVQQWLKHHQRTQQRIILGYTLMPFLILSLAAISPLPGRILLLGWLAIGVIAFIIVACYQCVDPILNTLIRRNKQERAFLPSSTMSDVWLTIALVVLCVLVLVTAIMLALTGFNALSVPLMLLCLCIGLPIMVITGGKGNKSIR